jgi:hypothetical protein
LRTPNSSSSPEPSLSERLAHARVAATVSEILDLGPDVLPHFEMAALPMLDGMERPGEEPRVRRRLRAEGIRASEHRGVLLVEAGELDRMSAAGFFNGNDEVFLVREWNDEFESFPGRVSAEHLDFNETSPLGLEEWMHDCGCFLAIGDGRGANVATLNRELFERLRGAFKPPKG